MGKILGGGQKVDTGPSQAELDAKESADKAKAKEEARLLEEEEQRGRNRRGTRSLLAEANTGRGFTAVSV